jgi:hypothetical protein
VEWEIGAPGKAYTKWFAQMAVSLDTGVPWIMCKQEDAPDPIVSTLEYFLYRNNLLLQARCPNYVAFPWKKNTR